MHSIFNIRPINAVAYVTFLALLRLKLTPFLMLLGIVFIALGLLMSTVDIGVRFRLFENLMLSAQTFLLHSLAWLYLFEVQRKEETMALFVLPLSTGISRQQYHTGRFLGVVWMVALFTLFFVIVDTLLLYWIESQWNFKPIIQIVLFALSALLAMAVFYFFSTFTATINAVIYSIIFWYIGNGLDELLHYAAQNQHMLLAVEILYYTLPNFSFFDLTSLTVNDKTITLTQYIFPMLYGMFYSLLLLLCANSIYARKPLYPTVE